MGDDESGRTRKKRSPPHPSIDLEEAIARAHELFEAEGLVEVPVTVAVQDWGYTEKSSTGIRMVAALNHYGLLDEEGSGSNRRVKLSDLARKILLDDRPNSKSRSAAIRKAALSPKVFRELFERFNGELPSAANLRFHLIDKLEFNPKKVDDVIEDYFDTIKFADLDGRPEAVDIVTENGGDSTIRATGRTPPKSETRNHDGESDTMPAVADSSEKKPWDWVIPLMEGKQAILRVPRPLSEEDFQHLEDMLTDYFPKQKRMLVSEEKGRSSSNGDSGD